LLAGDKLGVDCQRPPRGSSLSLMRHHVSGLLSWLLVGLAATGCAPTVQPPSAASRGPKVKGATSTRSPSASPTLTRRLEALVGALNKTGGKIAELAKLLAPHLPKGLAADDALPAKGVVKVVEVRRRGALLFAFARVRPEGWVAGRDDDTRERFYAASLARVGDKPALRWSGETFSVFESKAFETKQVAVRFPVKGLPVVALEFDYQPERGSLGTMTGRRVELYHLGTAERIHSDPILLSAEASQPGQEVLGRARLRWLAGAKAGTTLLAVTELRTTITHPCTGDPDASDAKDASCRDGYDCSRKTRVYRLGAVASAEIDRDAAAKGKQPALGKLPPDASGATKAACEALRKL
jgi:hypothetical protein